MIPPTCAALKQHINWQLFKGGIFGAKHLFHSLIFHFHIVGVGFEQMIVYMNHFGPHLKKRRRAVMNYIIVAAKNDVKHDASAKRRDCNAQLFASVKENVKQTNLNS